MTTFRNSSSRANIASSRTPFRLTAATNQVALAELLLGQGADTKGRDGGGLAATSLGVNGDHTALAAIIRKWNEKQKTSIRK